MAWLAEEDVRTAETEHTEYKATVSRLRKTYEAKVQDLRSHEEEEHAREKELTWPAPEHWSGSESGSTSGRERRDSFTGTNPSSRGTSPPPPLASPPIAPNVFVSGATSLGSASSSGYRDPPPAQRGVFDALRRRDWAAEGAKLGQRAVGVLAKGAEGGGGGQGSAKGAKGREAASRLKREAEKADRDFRQGVHQLETLRLQLDRVRRSGGVSLREFSYEFSTIVKQLLTSHVAELVSLGHHQTAVGERSRPDVAKIDPEADALDFARRLRDPVPAEPPVLYHNLWTGYCKDLLFGFSLGDYSAAHPGVLVPLIVQRCIDRVEHALSTEGIYRVSPKLATIQVLVHQIEKDERAFAFAPNEEPHTVAGILKLFLRQLPIPLFFFGLNDRVSWSAEYAADKEAALAKLTRRIRRLPVTHQATLKALLEHLSHVVAHEAENKMTATNLGLVFAPVVFGEEQEASIESAKLGSQDQVMEILILQQANIFGGVSAEALATARSRGNSSATSPPAWLPQPNSPGLLTLQTQSLYFGAAGETPGVSPSTADTTNDEHLSIPSSVAMSETGNSRDSVMLNYQHAASALLGGSPDRSTAARSARAESPMPPPLSTIHSFDSTTVPPQAVAAPASATVDAAPAVSPPVTAMPAAAFGSPSTSGTSSRHSPANEHTLDTPPPPLSAAEGSGHDRGYI